MNGTIVAKLLWIHVRLNLNLVGPTPKIDWRAEVKKIRIMTE